MGKDKRDREKSENRNEEAGEQKIQRWDKLQEREINWIEKRDKGEMGTDTEIRVGGGRRQKNKGGY